MKRHFSGLFWGVCVTVFFLCLAVSVPSVSAEDLCLELADAPESGIVLLPLRSETLAAVTLCNAEKLTGIRVTFDSKPLLSQYVHGEYLVLKLDLEMVRASREKTLALALKPVEGGEDFSSKWSSKALPEKEILTETSAYMIRQSADKNGGFPDLIRFTKTGKTVEAFHFRDRVQEKDETEDDRPFFGGWVLAQDADPELTLLSDGPICRVVRQQARYTMGEKEAPGNVRAVYDWFFFKDSGLVYVQSRASQSLPHEWDEHHFLELHVKDPSFDRVRGKTDAGKSEDGKPHDGKIDKRLEKSDTQGFFRHFGAFSDGRNFIGFPPESGFYDGKNYGPYLHAEIRHAWNGWVTLEKNRSAWLLLDSFDSPEDFDAAAEKFLMAPHPGYAKLTVREGTETLESAESTKSAGRSSTGTVENWRRQLAFSLLLSGRPNAQNLSQAILTLPAGQEKDGLLLLTSRDLALLLAKTEEKEGVSLALLGLADRKTGLCFTDGTPQPLFSCELRETETKRRLDLTSLSVWKEISIAQRPGTSEWSFTFRSPVNDETAAPLEWTLTILADPECSALEFGWLGRTNTPKLSFMRVCAGQLVCGPFGGKTCGLYPNTSGLLLPKPFSTAISRKALYPAGWCVMPWMAIWEENARRGIYAGFHDPKGSAKTVDFVSEPLQSQVKLAFTHSVPNMTVPGNETVSPGKFVLQPFDGNWFDAALIYRGWVRENAEWFPKLGPEGRPDTPKWVKELSIWAQGGGEPAAVVRMMRDFRDAFGLPCALHWYNWHRSPFDNDYPHYVPDNGFREAVNEIQKDGDIFVMPYINGRLWDTRDRGMEDFQFTSVALPAVTKNEAGEPFTETYRSLEEDGSKVRLGAMCPSTRLWQDKVASIIRGLMNDQCVKGVYVDQVAAAQPVMCMDPTHSHPLGGGSWWVASYAEMMRKIRAEMKVSGNEFSPGNERMLTTECNAETYADQFDGLLTWHLQSDQAVPAFAAVYGGAVQMFGRSYSGDDTAVRMKAAQQLIYGEQIGWFSPLTIKRKGVMEYVRPLVHFRNCIVPYFFKGEMAHPAEFLDPLPTVTSDWKWHGKTLVTMEAVQTSAWRILEYPESEKRDWTQGKVRKMVFIFTNFSDTPVKSRLRAHLEESGFADLSKVKVEKIGSDGTRTPLSLEFFKQEIDFAPFQTWGVELSETE